jgi:hypothetical protein
VSFNLLRREELFSRVDKEKADADHSHQRRTFLCFFLSNKFPHTNNTSHRELLPFEEAQSMEMKKAVMGSQVMFILSHSWREDNKRVH